MKKGTTITLTGIDFSRVADFMKFLGKAKLKIGGGEELLRFHAITEIEARQQENQNWVVSFKINTDFRGFPATTPEANAFFMDILKRVMGVFNEPE
jgi:hypothetical protein